MATSVGPRHPVTIGISDFTSPDNLTNDLLILNFGIVQFVEHKGFYKVNLGQF